MTGWPSLAPRAEAAPRTQMLRAQARAELTLLLRNGEQVLLTLVIPLGLLVVLSTVDVIDVTGRRVDFFVPGVLALAVMSTAFTGQAIGTGFERQYGVLKRLGATPLPRSVLLLAKTLAVLAVEVLQVALISLVGLVLGWHPHGSFLGVVLLVVLGTAAFSGLGLLIGGTLRGLTTLAAANLLWFVLLVLGGIVFPLRAYGGAADALRWLPTAALSDGLRQLLEHGSLVGRDLLALVLWAAAGLTAAAKLFRWE
ncbi:MAG: type transport system permease protein [Frankiales bacterium]|nr:type transport system permease protein [Frankiales bacterium]